MSDQIIARLAIPCQRTVTESLVRQLEMLEMVTDMDNYLTKVDVEAPAAYNVAM